MDSKIINRIFSNVEIKTKAMNTDAVDERSGISFKKRMSALRYFRDNTCGCHRKNEDSRFKCFANDLSRHLARQALGQDCRDSDIDKLLDWQTIPEMCMLDISRDKSYFNKGLTHIMIGFDGLEDLEQEITINASTVTMSANDKQMTDRQMATAVAMKYFEEFYKFYKRYTKNILLFDIRHTCRVYVLTKSKLYIVDILATVKG